MLDKSWRGAFLVSVIGVLSFTLTSAIVNLLIPSWLDSTAQPAVPGIGGPLEWMLVALVLVVAVALLVTVCAYWLYRFFGEAYFGPRGAARWALFGMLFALLLKFPDWITLPGGWIVKNSLMLVSVFIAFFTARVLIPIKKPRGRWRRSI